MYTHPKNLKQQVCVPAPKSAYTGVERKEKISLVLLDSSRYCNGDNSGTANWSELLGDKECVHRRARGQTSRESGVLGGDRPPWERHCLQREFIV